jgi:thiamine biosynthesis lipoprotein
VTSGDYERYYEVDGTRYHHILDPRTGYPSRSGLRSVTLIGDSALALDALSTAVFVLGAEKGLPLVQQAGYEAVLVTENLDVFCSEGLRGNFELL